jgi:hypothetical protein
LPFDVLKGRVETVDQRAKARAAAEALFKPRPQVAEEQTPAHALDARPSVEQHVPRAPRVLARLPVTPTAVEGAQTPALQEPEARPQKRTRRQKSGILPSHHGRIRTLALYGMTVEQVAELYGTSVAEIEGIISAN